MAHLRRRIYPRIKYVSSVVWQKSLLIRNISKWSAILWMSAILRDFCFCIERYFDNLSGSQLQTKLTSVQIVINSDKAPKTELLRTTAMTRMILLFLIMIWLQGSKQLHCLETPCVLPNAAQLCLLLIRLPRTLWANKVRKEFIIVNWATRSASNLKKEKANQSTSWTPGLCSSLAVWFVLQQGLRLER